ncbi:MAG TPA: hypothetical protein PLG79_03025 [Spirochaetales bacterium]|nr:hypothetical protein [Spirochaetales bacterium]
MRRVVVFWVVFLGGMSIEQAYPEKVPQGWWLSQTLGASINPVGIDTTSRFSFKSPLYPDKEGLLWNSAHWEFGAENSLTPAYDTFSFVLRLEPIAFFDLRLQGGIRYAYDALGFGYTPLPDYDAPFDSDSRRDLDRTDGFGFRYQISPTLKGAVGNILFASTFHGVVYDMQSLKDVEESYFYEPSANLVLKKRDGYVGNETVLAYRCSGTGFLLGVIHAILYVPASGYVTERFSVLGNYGTSLNAKTGIFFSLLAGYYPRDRYLSYREGKVYGAFQIGINRKPF